MDDVLLYSEGLNKDVTKLDQPKGSWREMYNGVLLSEEGQIFRPSNEKGTLEIIAGFPTGFKVIGGFNLNQDYITVLVDPVNGYSQVGIIDKNFTYTRKVPTDTDVNDELGFVIEHQVDCEAKKLFTGERILYFTDNYNPFGFVNLDNPPATGDIRDNVKLIQNQSITKIDLVEIIENVAGGIRPGVLHFATAYKDYSLNRTTVGLISSPVPMVPPLRSVGRDKYEGAYPTDTTINKNIKLQISNIDTSFPYLEVIAIYYEGLTNTFKAVTLPLINITSDKITFIYTGLETTTGEITLNELVELPISYDTAKCVAQKDDMLIFSNLADKTSRYDDILQKIANRITIGYQIKEVQYIDSSGSDTIFNLLQPPYVDTSDVPASTKVILEFNQDVSTTTGTVLVNYALDIDGDGTLDYNPISVTIVNNIVTLEFDTPPAPLIPLPTVAPFYRLKVTGVTNLTESQTYNDSDYKNIEYPSNGSPGIDIQNGFTDYKNEFLTFYEKGYFRNEVYSFGLVVTFKDGTQSFVYPIPGNNKITTSTTNAIPNTPGNYTGNTSGQLGTYVSTLEYPRNQLYPGNLSGDDTALGAINRNIRHHKMPSLVQEPHFRYDSSTKISYVRILGLRPDLTAAKAFFTKELVNDIQAIGFVRQRRNSPQNRSVIAQGIVNRLVNTYNDYAYDGGDPDTSKEIYKKNPFFDNTSIEIEDISPNGSGSSAAFHMGDPIDKETAFFSPDVLFNRISQGDVSGAILKEELLLNANVEIVNWLPSENEGDTSAPIAPPAPQGLETSGLLKFYLAFLKANYFQEDVNITNQEIPITEAVIISNNSSVSVNSLSKPIYNNYSLKFLYLHLQNDLVVNNPYNITVILRANTSTPFLGKSTYKNNDGLLIPFTEINTSTLLHNLTVNNPQQYGAINNNDYIMIGNHIVDYTDISQIQNNYGVDYGGDTFISKFSIANSDVYFYKGRLWRNFDTGAGKYTNANADSHIPGFDVEGMDLRGLSYFFVESVVNTNYRHQYKDIVNNTDGPKYYPKDNAYDVLVQDPRNGESDSYNTQYSFENNIRTFFSKSTANVTVGKYETRNIYSKQSQADDLIDNYRIFPTNNYHDIPKHTGEIWDTFVHQNTFYMHTPKCLWRGYVNELSQQANSLGEVITGTGGVFSIPSREVLTKEGGYGGTISQWAGVHALTGYIFPDALQGKIFQLTNGVLQDISLHGMSMYFDQNLGEGLITDYIDNPANPDSAGIVATYDSSLKRYILVKRGTTKDFTLSYSLLNNKWISHHNYSPNSIFPIDRRLFGFDNSKTTVQLHEHNVGPYGTYYNNPTQPFSIDVVLNYPPIIAKVYDNLAIDTTSYDGATVNRLDTFKLIRVTNDFQDSSNINLVCGDIFDDGSNVSKIQNKFQLAIPRNSVNTNPDFPDRMRDGYLQTHLEYPNTDNYKLIINSIYLAQRRSFR